jgi:PAS domain S-box-containing protein
MIDRHCVLIVDDDPKLRRTLSDILKMKGYLPSVAGKGREALDSIAEDGNPAIALIDLQLEDMSGLDVMRQIKERSPETECIVLTGYASKQSAIEAVNLGAYGYVEKPYDIEQLLLTIRRVVEKREIQKELRESEERHRAFLEQFQGIAYQSRYLAFTPLLFNGAVEEITGYKPEEFLSGHLKWNTIVHPEDLQPFLDEGKRFASEEGYVSSAEYRIFRKDGDVRFVRDVARLVDTDGTPTIQGTVVDITDRKRVDMALLNEKLLSESYINSLPGLFYVFDEKRFIKWNSEWNTITGYSDGELASMYGTDFFEGEDRSLIEERMLKVFQEGAADAEANLITKDGRRCPYLFTGLRKRIEGKDYLVGLGIDISRRKRLEAQLQQSLKMESIGTLAGGIAHDFNNMLGIILGNTEMAALDVPDQNPAQASLDEIKATTMRARDAVKQILAFSRQGEEKLTPIQIGSVVAESLKLIRSTIPTTIAIEQNVSKDAGIIMGDLTQINQILLNLCVNAAHAMREEGGVLTVTLERIHLDDGDLSGMPELSAGDHVNLSVGDTGQGIAPDQINRIFDPYFTTKGIGEGTGMGLAMVHGIVKSHDGAIKVDSDEGKGTVFSVFIPVIQSKSEVATVSTDDIPRGNEHILFVDDEPAMTGIYRAMLERLGYAITVRTSSIEALEAFKAKPDEYDAIITDQTMPHLTGQMLAMEMMAVRPDIPVILCTGHSDLISKQKANEIGIKAFVMKPIAMGHIAKTIREVLDNR